MKTEKVSYIVAILRNDQQHVVIKESEDFTDCYKTWEQLQIQWAECVKETKPFVVTDPIITAFQPGLIYEIILRPESNLMKNEDNNPYKRQMKEKGFSNSFFASETGGRYGVDY